MLFRSPVVPATLAAIREGFHAAHEQRYGYAQQAKEVELVTFRVKAMLPVAKPDLAPARRAGASGPPLPVSTRHTYFETGETYIDCPVFERAALAPGMRIAGPAIIEQMDTTTIVPPDFTATADEWGNLLLRTRGAAA